MANNARTIEDLERKYDFASILGLKKNVKVTANSLIKVENELSNMLNTLIINLKDVLDSQSEISLWFYSGTPTNSNEPYTSFETLAEHYGDIYYDQETGYVYKFNSNGWTLNTDTNLIQAMALTNVEIDTTTDHERKVYFEQPVPPYSSGDWWILSDGSLKICQLGKMEGLYETNDFIVSSKYVATVATKTGSTLTVLKGTVTEINENYVRFTDLETGGNTTINGSNIKSGTITLDNSLSIANDNILMDKTGITLRNGASIITDKGLMTNLQFQGIGYQGGIANGTGWKFCGFSPDFINSQNSKDFIEFLVDIPSNFTISYAYITLMHQPVYYTNISVYGYSRALGLYNAANDNLIQAEMVGGYYETVSSATEIPSAFGSTSGWTPSVPSSSFKKIETKKSIDIASKLTSGTLNRLIIQTKNNAPTFSSTDLSNCAKQTGRLKAVLNVYGFMKV